MGARVGCGGRLVMDFDTMMGGRTAWGTNEASPAQLAVVIALPMLVIGTAALVLWPSAGIEPVLYGSVGLVLAGLMLRVLHRYPWLASWGAVVIFCTSDELRLRLTPVIGVAKDVFVVVLTLLVVVALFKHREMLDRLRPFTGSIATAGLLVGLYLVNPAGEYGAAWFYGSRLLFEVLALGLLGMLCIAPGTTSEHLVKAMTVMAPFEAVFSWLQQLAGADGLTKLWAYKFGAQTRLTSDGGLRTSGTFDDPFQLAALGVLATAVALFLASRRQAQVLLISVAAILVATSVRTAIVQVGVLLLVYAVRRGLRKQALALGLATAVAGMFTLVSTTASAIPGGPEELQVFSLNGRTTAWDQAVQGPTSLFTGNGVAVLGSGSTRANQDLISAPPSLPASTDSPDGEQAGNSGFLDSSYAQVQSDVGIIGTLALIGSMIGFAVVLGRRCFRTRDGATWAAFGILAVSMIDWLGRSSLASYTTGFLTFYVLGVLIAASSPTDRGPSNGAEGPGEEPEGARGRPHPVGPPTAPTTPITPARPPRNSLPRIDPPLSPKPRTSAAVPGQSSEARP